MNETKITQIYVGLETQDGTEIKPSEIIDRISREIKAGTFHETKGLWDGNLENSIMFECANIQEHLLNHGDVIALKEELEDVFNQESVMVKQYESEVMF